MYKLKLKLAGWVIVSPTTNIIIKRMQIVLQWMHTSIMIAEGLHLLLNLPGLDWADANVAKEIKRKLIWCIFFVHFMTTIKWI